MSVFRNPVSYTAYIAIAILVLASRGESLPVVLQHIFVPYTVDVSRGVGDAGASIFRVVVFLSQAIIAIFLLLVANANEGGTRTVLSVLGVVSVICYTLLIAFGYVMPRFH